MTLDEVLNSLFPSGPTIETSEGGLFTGFGHLEGGSEIAIVGIADGAPLAPEGALGLAKHVLDVIKAGGDTPILVLVDTQGQLMQRRAEMLGLNEYLAHLAKCLLLASREGHRTIGLEYGKAAAGAFLATALATDVLVGLPGAEPAVMDLPSIARVTKLPVEKLKALSASTPIFAPGLDHLVQIGAVAEVWDNTKPLDAQLSDLLGRVSAKDERDRLGAERGGRKMAADVAARVTSAAVATAQRDAG